MLSFAHSGLKVFLLEKALLLSVDSVVHPSHQLSLHRIHGFLERIVRVMTSVYLGGLEYIMLDLWQINSSSYMRVQGF